MSVFSRKAISKRCTHTLTTWQCSEVRVSFDRVAEIYDRTRGFPSHAMRQLTQALTVELSGYKAILDAGVGTGRYARSLQESGFEVAGIDIARAMIGKAEERGVSDLVLGDACFLPFKNNSFDATVCIHLLHLIREWKAALQEICRVTRSALVSLIYVYKNPMWDAYDRLLKAYGYEGRRFGKGEWELKNLVSPSRSVFAAAYDAVADERLEYLSRRAYSYQWEIPEDINEKVVEKLKRQFAGTVFHQELLLLTWDIEDLQAFCEPADA